MINTALIQEQIDKHSGEIKRYDEIVIPAYSGIGFAPQQKMLIDVRNGYAEKRDQWQAILEAVQKPVNEWQPIETVPEDVYVDVWVKSRENSSYGKRVCNVFRLNNKWFGATRPDEWHSEYAAFWMPLPKPPSDV
jgi:hypothetical protein